MPIFSGQLDIKWHQVALPFCTGLSDFYTFLSLARRRKKYAAGTAEIFTTCQLLEVSLKPCVAFTDTHVSQGFTRLCINDHDILMMITSWWYGGDIYPLDIRCAPGTLGCLDPRKCPRANPSSTPWSPKNRRTKKNAWELRFHRSEVSTIPPLSAEMDSDNSDLKRHSLRFEDSYRLKPSQVRELLEAGQEVTLEKSYPTFTLRYIVFSFEHPNMILKKMKKQLHIRKASSAKGPSAHHRIGPMWFPATKFCIRLALKL